MAEITGGTSPARPAARPQHPITLWLLDYDDTLFYTSWMTTQQYDKRYKVNSCFATAIFDHESACLDLISKACGGDGGLGGCCRSVVVIVSNGRMPWIRDTMQDFMPRLWGLLIEEGVEIISARDLFSGKTTPYTWKEEAFAQVFEKVDGVVGRAVVIGDGQQEMQGKQTNNRNNLASLCFDGFPPLLLVCGQPSTTKLEREEGEIGVDNRSAVPDIVKVRFIHDYRMREGMEGIEPTLDIMHSQVCLCLRSFDDLLTCDDGTSWTMDLSKDDTVVLVRSDETSRSIITLERDDEQDDSGEADIDRQTTVCAFEASGRAVEDPYTSRAIHRLLSMIGDTDDATHTHIQPTNDTQEDLVLDDYDYEAACVSQYSAIGCHEQDPPPTSTSTSPNTTSYTDTKDRPRTLSASPKRKLHDVPASHLDESRDADESLSQLSSTSSDSAMSITSTTQKEKEGQEGMVRVGGDGWCEVRKSRFKKARKSRRDRHLMSERVASNTARRTLLVAVGGVDRSVCSCSYYRE
ncbi:unnamed protein product [Vitrella brassicaformis CCMP3155]|uniref:Uncharacterized protein n=1 Tax=Vitrella brassicaformis (strain CCMP3155) TaxID=1169540 RepID=A0A0G4EIG6_VITBC|nr:unnamed protein product [Vitrella brassicaformis CCMP3155]|eukprot:CEL95776.1 unnamed protein product [Vitrella brassicaformis CCMP3155]